MHLIPKTLYLPSGGLLYTPTARIRKVTSQYYFGDLDESLYDTKFDKIQSIINFYSELPVKIENMLLYDIYYIYSYMLTADINEDVFLNKKSFCNYCGHIDDISLSAANFDIHIYDPYIPLQINNTFISSHDVKVILNHRTVLHNMQFATLLALQENDFGEFEFINTIVLYILTQTKDIFVNKVKCEKRYWKDILFSFITLDVINLFTQTMEFNKSIGIYDKLRYTCPNCGKSVIQWYFDDMINNRVITNIEIKYQDKLNIIKSMIGESRLPCFSLQDIIERPLHYNEIYSEAIQQTDFKNGMIML